MKFIGLVCVLFLLSSGPCLSAPLEVYGQLPRTEDVQISPDGKKIALMNTKGETRAIFVFGVQSLELIRGAPAGSAKVRSMRWADNDTIIFMLSEVSKMEVTARELSYGYMFTISTGQQKPLVFNDPQALNQIYSTPQTRLVDGKAQVFFRAMGVKFGQYDGDILVRSSPHEKRSYVVKRGDFRENQWLVGADGEVVAETSFNEDRWTSRMTIFGPKGRLKVTAPEGYMLFDALGLSADGRSIIAAYGVPDAESNALIAEVSMETGEWSKPLLDPDAELLFDPLTARLFATHQLVGDKRTISFTDPVDGRFWKNTEKAFAGSDVTAISWSADRSRVVVHVDSPSHGPAFALVDRATNRAEWLSDDYALEPGDVAAVTPIRYKAADGLEITGYLTLPNGQEAKALPLIVLPHGGPAARDVPGFDWWSQALASRGYAVLRPNFRGSAGFGVDFRVAGHGEWGAKMQTDLSDGVRYLAAKGTIDPARVCIAGASYGGYAALAGATLDRGVYRCAASVAGPSDLQRMVQVSKETGGEMAESYWNLNMGAKHWNDPALNAISPVKHAAKVDIPLLLIHGKDDSVVQYEQTTRMAQAMAKANKPVEVVTLGGEDHWLSKSETRLKMLTSLVAFVEKHNPPNAPTKTASLP